MLAVLSDSMLWMSFFVRLKVKMVNMDCDYSRSLLMILYIYSSLRLLTLFHAREELCICITHCNRSRSFFNL